MTKPDIVLVTESWCNNGITNAYLGIEGYEIQPDLRRDRIDTDQGRGGGLLVYVKTGLKVLKIDNTVDFTQYCAFIISDVTVYLLYRSPNAAPASMAELVNLVKSVGKNSIIIGDFNLPDISWETGEASGRAREFVEATDDALLVQMVEFPTHVKGNCLDLVLTNIPERIEEVCEGGDWDRAIMR